jgi:alpha-tubulin suppressor-like RCC1 family protein
MGVGSGREVVFRHTLAEASFGAHVVTVMGDAMISRSMARAGALGTAGAVVAVIMTAALPLLGCPPAAAGEGPTGLLSWGSNTSGQLGAGFYGSYGPNSCPSDNACSTTPVGVLLPSGVTATAIAGGGYSGYAIGSDGHLYAWGGGGLGALGNGMNTGDSNTPVQVSLPSGVSPVAIAASVSTAYAIGSDGHLYAWGANNAGQLGDGTNSPICGSCGSAIPVVVSLPQGVAPTAIAAGGYTAYAIGSDGHLYAWGDNVYGNLGVGNTHSSAVPLQVALPPDVSPTAVAAAGGYAAYAIGSDDHLYAWGNNYYGELGDGTTRGGTRTPRQIPMPAGVNPVAISGSDAPDGYAIGSDGNLYAWGDNSVGELGNGFSKGPNRCHSISCSKTPTRVSLPSGVSPAAIAGGGVTAYAIGSDGHLYAWGDNSVGQFGNGSLTDSESPSLVPLPPGFTPDTLGPEPDAQTAYVIGTTGSAPLTITTSSLPPATVDVAYSATLSATGGNPPYKWKVIAGSLPKGITLNRTTGVISGTTKQTGVITFTVEVQTTAPTRPPTRSTATKDLSIQLNGVPS